MNLSMKPLLFLTIGLILLILGAVSGTLNFTAHVNPLDPLNFDENGIVGRVYLILVTATDAAGNTGYSCCTVTVPHSQSAKAKASAAAQAAAAEAECAGAGGPPASYFLLTPVPIAATRR